MQTAAHPVWPMAPLEDGIPPPSAATTVSLLTVKLQALENPCWPTQTSVPFPADPQIT